MPVARLDEPAVNLRNPSIVMQAEPAAETRRDGDVSRLRLFAARISAVALPDEIAKEIVGFAAEAVNCEACGVYLADSEANLVLHSVQLFHPEALADRFEWFASIPLTCGGRVAGAVNLLGRNGHAPGEDAVELIATAGALAGAEIERLRLASENAELTDRLETRKIVERAKGILQRNLSLSEEDAYLKLQRESRQRRKSMKEVAEAIVLNEELNKKK